VREVVIDRPVFVVGTGRCGLTPLMHLVALHEDFAWPSQFNDRFSSWPWVSYLSRLSDLRPFRGPIRQKWFFPRHTETYRLWDRCSFGFREPFRDLRAEDVSPLARAKFRKVATEVLAYQGKSRFITEYSGWSRIGYIREIFPDALFIHIVRDGRAVANSLTNVNYWRGWGGVAAWRWGPLDESTMDSWERYDRSFLALAAIQWNICIGSIEAASSELTEASILTVRYEDLVSDRMAVARRAVEFCGLEFTPRFERHLPRVLIGNANQSAFRIPPWRENLSARQIDMLSDVMQDGLTRFGYLGE
jgi:omega-hydroxy-beta-dihydromenaquinone-9 sulfotransferase